MNRKTKIFFSTIITLLILGAIVWNSRSDAPMANKLHECPDNWVDNQMPTTDPDPGEIPREYFIINGERRELVDFDVDWIKENCEVNAPRPVF